MILGLTQKIIGSTTDSYAYMYDSLGNITAINRSGYEPLSYTYDAQNQLVSVLEGDFRYDFTYDTYGNILSVACVEDYSDEVVSSNTYTYGNPQWLDRLTAFNGHDIAYDEIGNPLTYYNGSDYAFTWDGRELATATKGSTSLSYNYGADGLRTQKTVGSTVYNYYYADGLLVRQTWGSNYIDFLYDESGNAYSFVYNGTQYYYVRNLQGDVVKILDTSGGVVASYTYDAWGKVTSSGSIGQINPIRYRGYYYDTETGFYYLQSRYYDPTIKRFISADDVSYLGANGDFVSLNLYAYCGNNPVMGSDPLGKWTISFGKTYSAYVFSGISFSWNIVMDSSGNIAFQVSKANIFEKEGGVVMGIASLGVSANFTRTEFDTYRDLEGPGLSAGLSISAGPISAGKEKITPLDDFNVVGTTKSLGVGIGSPVDVSVTASITETKWSFNIYDS